MNRHAVNIGLFLSLGLLLSCGSSRPAVDTAAPPVTEIDDRPAWVRARPVSSSYYIGIGQAPKLPSIDYLAAAKQRAMEDLVSDIKVVVSGNSLLYTLDRDYSFREEYLSNIKTTVNAEIEEFELVDSYETDKAYWVYYRLSKQQYQDLKKQKEDEARSLALDYYGRARKKESEGKVSAAVDNYILAFDAIRSYLNEPLQAEYGGEEIWLANEMYAHMQQLLDELELSGPEEAIPVGDQDRKEIHIPVSLHYRDKPVNQFPLRAYFQLGKGDLITNYRTQEGNVSITVRNISSRNARQEIMVEGDVDALASGRSEATVQGILKTLRMPRKQVILEIIQPTLYLTSDEKNLGSPLQDQPLTRTLRSLLTQQGLKLTDDVAEATYILEVESDTEPHSTANGFFVAYLNGTVRVIARETRREIYNSGPIRVKGVQLSHEKAGRAAYTESAENLELKVVPGILKTIN